MRSNDIIWQKVRSQFELELPQDREDALPVQGFHIPAKTTFIITNRKRNKYGLFAFDGAFRPTKDSSVLSKFIHIGTNDVVMLSDYQLHELQKAGRIRPVIGPGDGPKNMPGSSLTVSGPKREKALRNLEYADAIEDYMREHDTWTLTDEQKARIVAEVAERIGDPNPPRRSKWYELMKKARTGQQFDRLLNFVDNDAAKGNRTARYGSAVAEAIRVAAHEVVALQGDWHAIKSTLVQWARPGEEYHNLRDLILDNDGVCKIPDSKIQRVLGAMNRYVYDFFWNGPDYAERVHKRTLSQIRPDAPLAIVDIDHTTVGLVVIDDEYPIVYGRPDLLVFRDRCTAIRLGWGVAFGAPSYQTFLEGLKHAMFEKDPALMNGVAYPWWGTPTCLGVDNARHLIGLNIRAAAKEFGFQTRAYRPAHPWEKGALEVLFGILGRKLVHRLPGTTMGSAKERDEYDDEKELAVPVLTMSEFTGFLNYYFAFIEHYRPTQGIAELATLKGVPAERWEQLIENAPQAPIIDRDIFTRLGGDVGTVTIQTRGCRWDYLTYQCAELVVLATHPKHKSDRKYEARRDPGNLGSIEVKDPYSKAERWINVPICDADRGYAEGLKLHVHRAIVKYKRDQEKKADRDVGLQEARREMEANLVELHARRKKHKTAQMLARFYEGNVRKEQRSRVIEMGRVEYTEGRLDLAAMPAREPPPRMNRRAIGVMPSARVPIEEQPKAVVSRTSAPKPIPQPAHHHYDTPSDDDGWDV